MNNKYKIGDVVVGRVTGIEQYGFFVNIDNKYNGLVHISEISDDFVKNIKDYVSIDEEIKVKILEINDNKIKLSIKNMNYKKNAKEHCYIKETETGFETLKSLLDTWIAKKIAVITKK